MRYSITVRVVGGLLFTLLGTARAGDSPDRTIGKIDSVGKIHVAYSDLNLNHPGDLQILLDRLRQAAYVACGGNPRSHRSYPSQRQEVLTVYEACRREAVGRAVSALGFAPLSELYRESR